EVAGERIRHPDVVGDGANEILAAGLPRKLCGSPPRIDRFVEVTRCDRGKELAIAKRVLAARSQGEIFGGRFSQSFGGDGESSGVFATFYVGSRQSVQRRSFAAHVANRARVVCGRCE